MQEAEEKVGTDIEEKLKTGKQTKREGCGGEMVTEHHSVATF